MKIIKSADPAEGPMEALKREIDEAITKNFRGNPNKPWRPKTDPGKGGGFVNYSRKGLSTPPATGVFGGPR